MTTSQADVLNEAPMLSARPTSGNAQAPWRSFFKEVGMLLRGRPRSNGATPFGGGPDVLDLTHDAICVRGMDGVIEHWNAAAEKLYGWTAGEAIGRVSHVLFKTVFPAPLDRIEAELMRTGTWEGELLHWRKDGTCLTVASRWTLLRDNASAENALLEANNDITERKHAQAESAKLEERLHQAEKLQAIGRFASGIVHDFNNVLYGIMAYGEMLVEEAPDVQRKRYAQNVLTAATRGRELVEQLLRYTRSLRGKHAPTDVCCTVAETLEILRPSVPHSVTLNARVPAAPLVVMGSAAQMHQVVMNLCSNALQAMEAGGSLDVEITAMDLPGEQALSHGTFGPGPCVCLRVEDEGCGMDEATLAHIFETFYTTREAGRGTGLGLSLVSAIVTDLGGAIDVKTVPGEGSIFSVYLPMAQASEAAVAGA